MAHAAGSDDPKFIFELMNGSDYDFNGGAVDAENKVADDLGLTQHQRVSYAASMGSSDPRFALFTSGKSYTKLEEVDIVRVGDVDEQRNSTPGRADLLDNSNRTDNSRDLMFGLGGEDELRGGGGNDFLYGGDGADWLFGDDGNDRLHGGELGDVLEGGAGDDTLWGSSGADRLSGGDGDDRLFADEEDSVRGDAGNDEIIVSNFGRHIYGGDGNDIIRFEAASLGNKTVYIGDSDPGDRLYYNGHLVTSPTGGPSMSSVEYWGSDYGAWASVQNLNDLGLDFRLSGSDLYIYFREDQAAGYFPGGSSLDYDRPYNTIIISDFQNGDLGFNLQEIDTDSFNNAAFELVQANNFGIGFYTLSREVSYDVEGANTLPMVSEFLFV